MLWICKACTSRYSVGASTCPQCGADDHIDEGQEHLLKKPGSPKPATSRESGKDTTT